MPPLHHTAMSGGQCVKVGGKWRCPTRPGAPAIHIASKGDGKGTLLWAGCSASEVHRRRGTCSVGFQRGDHVGGTPPPPRWDH